MYIAVNHSLSMGKGKMCGQVGHAVAAMIRKLHNRPTSDYHSWLDAGETKIVVRATQDEITRLANVYADSLHDFYGIPIYDAGKTQIDCNSLTVICFCPIQEKKIPSLVKNLKLL